MPTYRDLHSDFAVGLTNALETHFVLTPPTLSIAHNDKLFAACIGDQALKASSPNTSAESGSSASSDSSDSSDSSSLGSSSSEESSSSENDEAESSSEGDCHCPMDLCFELCQSACHNRVLLSLLPLCFVSRADRRKTCILYVFDCYGNNVPIKKGSIL